MQELMDLLKGSFPAIDWDNEKNLATDGIMDSVTMVGIITELEDHYDIEVTMEYIQPSYFESAETIYEIVEELA